MVPPTCPSKKNSGGQRDLVYGVVHHFQREHHPSMKEWFYKKIQKIRIVRNVPPYLFVKKKIRWTARVRTWSSPPSSARTTSIYLDTKLLGANHPAHHTHHTHHPKQNFPLFLNQLIKSGKSIIWDTFVFLGVNNFFRGV